MHNHQQFYINGQWVSPQNLNTLNVINPATEETSAKIAIGSHADVDLAVNAARQAFDKQAFSSREDRIEILQSIIAEYKNRYDDIADAISEEMGAPITLAIKSQTASGLGHLKTALKILSHFSFEQPLDDSLICKEPIGVCGLITPWNWPMNQIACKVAPAIATGCTMILKPSEIAPLSALIFTEIIDKAGVPAGVFNMINGDGDGVGTALAEHPLIDMISFTGSTRAGSLVAQNAAPTIKRVTQELGGKSPNIILDDADLENAVKQGTHCVFSNAGQSCDAPTRMLVPRAKMQQAAKFARQIADQVILGNPKNKLTTMGPVASAAQFQKVQNLILKGIEQGATLICGGPGKPKGLDRGYFVRPTVFCDVNNQMHIAREEIFGPVLSIIPYDTEAEAVQIANDTPYGLAGYIQGNDPQKTNRISRQLRAGNIYINGQSGGLEAPFGGYKRSGNGREWGEYGFADYLEIKTISGLTQAE